ncbi:MAG: hypothetical protein SPL73_05760 [Cyanobacteriota bacterium]|nr:hypothetical protein [Cyanobacteriota bacterium]
MIYDCFMFFNELDLLEIRLNTLNNYVDKFVIVEATKNFSFKEKPLYFEQNKDRFKQFNDKIIHIVVDKYPPKDEINDWTMETFQRNCISDGLKDCKDDDIIIISDIDEIPRPEFIKKYYNPDRITAFNLSVYIYFLNNYTLMKWTRGPKILSYKNFKHILDDIDYSKMYAIDPNVNQGTTATLIRIYEGKLQTHIKNAGWHFSYMGNAQNIIQKYESMTENHRDFKSDEDLYKLIHAKKFMDTWYFFPVGIDDSFPKYLKDNQDKYSDMIIHDGCKKFSLKYKIWYKARYILDNIFAIRTEIRCGVKRTNLILFGIKMRIRKESLK